MDARALAWGDSVSVIPLRPQEKKPALETWTEYQTRKATREERAEWKKQFPGCNWGLVCCKVSNVVALDFDGEAGKALFKEHGLHGKQPTNITGKGFHGLFLLPEKPLKNGVRIIDGLDIRSDGGYIVIPPSIHPSGSKYAWQVAPWMIPPPPLPDWVTPLLDKRENAIPSSIIGSPDGLPPGVGEGQRNPTAAQYAGRYLAKGLSAEETFLVLRAWNGKNSPPMPENELRSVIFSIASKEAAKAVPLEVIGAAELVRTRFEVPPMQIKPFLPSGGKAVLAGNSGTGKTLLAENLAYSIASEIPLFGRFDVVNGNVLYVDSESTQDLTRARIGKIRQGLNVAHAGVSFVFPGKRLDLGIQRNREDLCREIEQEKAALCVLDSFLCFANLKSENDNSEVRARLENLSDIPKATGAALLILDHAAKASLERAKAGIGVTARGAGAKHDWADVVLTFEEKKNEHKFLRTLRFAKTRFCAPLPAMILEMDGNLVFIPTSEDEICPTFTVKQAVEETPGIAAGKLYALLMTLTGCSDKTAKKATARAVELGSVRREERSKFVNFYPGLGNWGSASI
jgi:KaiC/GvpD/RAD55 family RecA-like ATPase